MPDKKYYWLKLKKDFFKRHDIKIVENMPNGKDYVLFYLKLLLESIDHDGSLRFSNTIPYSEQMLATVTDTNIDIVRSALKVFQELELIEILDDQTLYMTEVNKMIGSETEWAEKQRNYRLSQKKQKEDIEGTLSDTLSGQKKTLSDKSKSKRKSKSKEIELDSELEKDKESEKEESIEKVKDTDSCAELNESAPTPTAPQPVIRLILNDKSLFPIYQDDVDRWQEAYPAVDVMQELRKMSSWCYDNPTMRKTVKGVRRFVNSWLSTEQDKGGNRRTYYQRNSYDQKQANFEYLRSMAEEAEREVP